MTLDDFKGKSVKSIGDRFNLVVINSADSYTGKWKILFAIHYRPTTCYDVCFFNTETGFLQRHHFNDDKPQAMTLYSETRDKLQQPKEAGEDAEKPSLTIYGPDGREVKRPD